MSSSRTVKEVPGSLARSIDTYHHRSRALEKSACALPSIFEDGIVSNRRPSHVLKEIDSNSDLGIRNKNDLTCKYCPGSKTLSVSGFGQHTDTF